ncbi:hypothetical protein SLT67_15965 [Paenibacillus illinoisensis]|uniref:hypothetical protein n=1 Tax=Paenibacillus illinoisensis TaxID=59845 RepID=UPI003CF44182
MWVVSGAGTYSIFGNTITLKFADGKTERFVFFVYSGKEGNLNSQDIQIGDRDFYVDNDL